MIALAATTEQSGSVGDKHRRGENSHSAFGVRWVLDQEGGFAGGKK